MEIDVAPDRYLYNSKEFMPVRGVLSRTSLADGSVVQWCFKVGLSLS